MAGGFPSPAIFADMKKLALIGGAVLIVYGMGWFMGREHGRGEAFFEKFPIQPVTVLDGKCSKGEAKTAP